MLTKHNLNCYVVRLNERESVYDNKRHISKNHIINEDIMKIILLGLIIVSYY